jgi:hypothetical protein
MSFDLFLFRLDPNSDFDAAMTVLDRLMDKKMVDPVFDARNAVDDLLRVEPRYRRIDFDYLALARVRRTTEDVVRREFDFVQVDGPGPGPGDRPMAQFCFCESYISVSWYSGTTEVELDLYLKKLCQVTGYSVVDPQNGQIYRLQTSGELK